MVLCGVCFRKSDLNYLEEIGVKDSKKLTSEKRNSLAKLIKSRCVCYKEIMVGVDEIDNKEKNRISLNQLEAFKISEIINDLKAELIYIDAADTNEKRFAETILKLMEYTPIKLISKHKADDIYPIVSAASIIAKTKRDKIINELRETFLSKGYSDMGSGYTSDKRTIEFLREWIKSHKEAPACARKSWKTTKRIMNEEVYNRKITQFFN